MDGATFQALIEGLLSTLNVTTLLLMSAGIVAGFVIGILPGLGGTAALALMLPFTFAMDPVSAFALLLGMLASSTTASDLTSVVLGVPGDAVSTALVLDGYGMSKRGQGGRAIGAVLTSSMLGALAGAFVLAIAVPVVRPIVLAMGSPELFAVTLLGITTVGAVVSGAPIKGLILAAFGVMLSTVGQDPQTGVMRYTFGEPELWGGLGLVPVTIGMFALPEIFDMAVRNTSVAGTAADRIDSVMAGVRDTFRHWWLVLRSAVIAIFIGLLPGLGGSVAQWVSYGHAVQGAKDKDLVGKGAIEGVIGPGTASNAKDGASLIPTVAFGVPGSVSMAILLGAFLIQGLVPGPSMLTTQLPLTFSFVWVLIFSNIVTVVLCLLVARRLRALTTVSGRVLFAPVMVLLLVASFAEKRSFLDVLIMVGFGVLGWFMMKLDWPRAPFVLGFVLGGLAERYLFISVDRYGMGWVTRPGVILLGGLTVLGLVVPITLRIRAARVRGAAEHQQPPEGERADATDAGGPPASGAGPSREPRGST